MQRVRAVTQKRVMRGLLKDRTFRRGYEEELEKLHLVDAMIALRQQQGLTQAGLAKRLKVNSTTVYRLVRLGQLPGFKVGGQWRFNKKDVV